MKEPKIIGMSFVCDRKWDSMTVSENGRFCQSCKKEVLDFTESSPDVIWKAKQESKELCGRFSVEQIDPYFLAEIRIPRNIKNLAFWTSFFLIVSARQSFAQSSQKVATEQYAVSSDTSIFQEKTVEIPSDTNSSDSEIPQKTEEKQKWSWRKYTRHHIIYATKKFPFIKIRRRYIMGKIRL